MENRSKRNQAREMYNAGYFIHEIAKALDITEALVVRYLGLF